TLQFLLEAGEERDVAHAVLVELERDTVAAFAHGDELALPPEPRFLDDEVKGWHVPPERLEARAQASHEALVHRVVDAVHLVGPDGLPEEAEEVAHEGVQRLPDSIDRSGRERSRIE